MLGYRHAFHAGNHADVLKHLVLTECLAYMTKKDTPLRYVDTHAGAGLYTVGSQSSETTGEYLRGVGTLLDREDVPTPLIPYLNIVRDAAREGKYLGSPALAATLLRSSDELRLAELHPSDYEPLSTLFQDDRRVRVERGDGFALLKSALPPPTRRGLILMDPSFELAEDYWLVRKALQEGLMRFSTGTYLMWYPLLDREEARAFPRQLMELCGEQTSKKRALPCLRAELLVRHEKIGERGLFGSGMLVVNPPWPLKAFLEVVLPYLSIVLEEETGGGAWNFELQEPKDPTKGATERAYQGQKST